MILYRLTKPVYADDLSGNGAKLYGGRWNSKGNPMVYMASSQSLAVLEVLVHLDPLLIPGKYTMVTIEAPDDFEMAVLSGLPQGWNETPDDYNLKPIGDTFLSDNKHLLLQVPSLIVPQEFNYLANPTHKLAHQLKVLKTEPFSFDKRLL